MVEENRSEKVKSKRGRKKKWESTGLKNYSLNTCDTPGADSSNTFNTFNTPNTFNTFNTLSSSPDSISNSINKKDTAFQNLNFGNLTIKVKEKEEKPCGVVFLNNIKTTNCKLDISDEEDETKYKISKKTTIRHCPDTVLNNNLKCYHCHHSFENKPFYIPLKYSEQLDRYKLFGNFCSPNCAKSYCMSNKLLENKTYLLAQFYRKLFGADFKITPAPSFLKLKEYGGNLSIEEFRKFSYNNDRYILHNISCEMIFLN